MKLRDYFAHGDRERPNQDVCDLFSDKLFSLFNNRLYRFQETGSTKDGGRPGKRKSSTNEDDIFERARESFVENPHT